MISKKLATFGTSVFTEMTGLATRHDAINLAQGFPDFEGPPEILAYAERALRDGHNQYARSIGVPALTRAIASRYRADYDLRFDDQNEVCVCSGATEALAASAIGLLDPGDEVLLFEPFYDAYPALCAIAGATHRAITLRFPGFALDAEALARAVTPKTRMLVVNTPHNPTGKVFTADELAAIAAIAREHDLVVVADEVYEHLFFDGARHVPIATLPGMRERTLTISSTGKTFSLTGWKIGWAVGPEPLVAAVAAAHQFLTFASATPLQHAMAEALERFTGKYRAEFRAAYSERRGILLDALEAAGFAAARPQGTYFVLASYGARSDEPANDYARRLVGEQGIAAIPCTSFYSADRAEGERLLRFAFCKRSETLRAAASALRPG